jgi:membrane protease YdiL (CAAX protease family)
MLGREVLLVLALSLGASGVSALISLVGDLTAPRALKHQTTVLVGSQAPGRPWLDLSWQLFGLATALVPVLLVGYLLARDGESVRDLGLDAEQKARDLGRATLVAAGIGGSGLALYLAARGIGANLTVVPTTLPAVWWRFPVLVLSAVQNGVLEEVIVLGYLMHRLRQCGWSFGRATLASATLRGSYHLYQGFGGFAGNAVMGLVFCWLYRRWGRVMPLLVAHVLIDLVAFVGYAALAGHVGWLPTH